eukprot:comp24511_c0_seq1/m.46760 comp24511_c0_seq1/g.46760  ORF comp24511_c0_seq1/g.46760 comp24511_c0_seq1/m.46760 type:complete len:254 (-) comp24511_c0_seq1:58-819(-)
MSSIGTGYDLSATTFSPDGRVFQVEYAGKAVENSGTAIAVRCKDGVVFGVEKIILSKLYEPDSNPRNFTIDRHIGLAFSGLSADARQIVNRARSEAASYRNSYGVPIPCKILAERIAGFMQVYTLYSHIRPFGCSVLIGAFDDEGPQLYMVEPSGVSCGFHGCAVGKGRQAARTELEKMDLGKVSCRDAINTLAKIIYTIHDDVKDKEFELEMSWVGNESGRRHTFVPSDIVKNAADAAKKAMEDDSDDGGDH